MRGSWIIGIARRKQATMEGVARLSDITSVQFIFDLLSIAIVKQLFSFSLCSFSDTARAPYLLADPGILCQTLFQIAIAIAGWFGITVWYLWLPAAIARKSVRAETLANFYDFWAIAGLMQSHVIPGVASSSLRKTRPPTLLLLVFATIRITLWWVFYRGPPCRISVVHSILFVGLIVAMASAVVGTFFTIL